MANSSTERVEVALEELIDVLETRTKMRRSPAGVTSTGLRDVAIHQKGGWLEFEMPGITQSLKTNSGNLSRSVFFPTKTLPNVIKVLKTQMGNVENCFIEVNAEHVSFKAGTSKLSLKRLRP